MPAAAASALSPRATRILLIAMTAVHALCSAANKIPEKPNISRREKSDCLGAAPAAASGECASRAEYSAMLTILANGTVSRPIKRFVLEVLTPRSHAKSQVEICLPLFANALRMTTLELTLGFSGEFWRNGFSKFDAPGEFAGVEDVDANLVGFGGAKLADPGDAETAFAVPAAFNFDDFSGSGEVGHVVEACTVFADVQSV